MAECCFDWLLEYFIDLFNYDCSRRTPSNYQLAGHCGTQKVVAVIDLLNFITYLFHMNYSANLSPIFATSTEEYCKLLLINVFT